MSLTICYLIKSNVHACAWCMRIGIICVFQEKAKKTQTIFCRTYRAFFCHFCRTNLALSDISCVFWSFLSDISSCGHIWPCRTYLAGTGPTSQVRVWWPTIVLLHLINHYLWSLFLIDKYKSNECAWPFMHACFHAWMHHAWFTTMISDNKSKCLIL